MRFLGDIGDTTTTAVGVASTALQFVPGWGQVAGAVLGLAAGLLGGKKPSKAEMSWDAYKKGAGANPGRAYQEKDFADSVKGAFDTNQDIFPNTTHENRERWLAKFAREIVGVFNSQKVPLNATAPMIWKAVEPHLSFNRARFKAHAQMQALMYDIIDRYIGGLPITRRDMKTYAGSKDYAALSVTPSFTKAIAPLFARLKAKATAASKKPATKGALPAKRIPRSKNTASQAKRGGLSPLLLMGGALALLS